MILQKYLQLSVKNSEATEEFRKTVFDEFPIVKSVNSQKLEFGLNIEDKNKDDDEKDWMALGVEIRTNVFRLNDTFLELKYNGDVYTDFISFNKDVSLILNALNEYAPINPVKIGLRHMHKIDNQSYQNLEKCVNDIVL